MIFLDRLYVNNVTLSQSIAANSMSVVFDINKCPKKSVGRTPVDVLTRIIESKAIGRLTSCFTSSINLSPSIFAWKKIEVNKHKCR